jgi:hypothetical protein
VEALRAVLPKAPKVFKAPDVQDAPELKVGWVGGGGLLSRHV